MPKQKGGTKLYGPTIKGLTEWSSINAGRGYVPNDGITSTCQSGGGLDFSNFSGKGHRPIFKNTGYGYTQESALDNHILKGASPTVTSYENNTCGGGRKKRSNKRKRTKRSNKRTKRSNKRTKRSNKRTKRSNKRTKRTKRSNRKRTNKRYIKRSNRKRTAKRRKLVGCGQKGGNKLDPTPNPTFSFDPINGGSMAPHDFRTAVGNAISTNQYTNSFDNYNHYTK